MSSLPYTQALQGKLRLVEVNNDFFNDMVKTAEVDTKIQQFHLSS